MEIIFNQDIEFIIKPAQIGNFNKITITNIVDSYIQKKVIVYTKETAPITLWEGDAYNLIGQWTDQDVLQALKFKYEPNPIKKGKK